MNGLEIVAQLTALIFGVTAHEFAHAWVGHQLGDTTAKDQGRLTMNPIAHIDPIATLLLPIFLILIGSPVIFAAAKPVPFNPWALQGGRWGAALVAVAGPLTNLMIAGFVALWLQLMPLSAVSATFLLAMVLVNVGLFVFNMIPFPPLDGSRVLYAMAPPSWREVLDRIERMGFAVLLIVMLFGFQYISPYVAKVTTFIVHFLIGSLRV
ncbi:site-2 protease family protein [bacterium]|nr:MAG: site-2 protease family protein [bacterium]